MIDDLQNIPSPASPALIVPSAGLGALQGHLDTLTHSGLSGWVSDVDNPNDPVALIIRLDGHIAGRVLANRFRKDLRDAGVGSGYHGFSLDFPMLSPLLAHRVQITREVDDAKLLGGLHHLLPATSFDIAVENSLAGLLGNFVSAPAEARALAFLVKQTDLLLARHADRQASRSARQAQALLRRRWKGLDNSEQISVSVFPALAPRALIIDDRIPKAGRDAGSVAILSHMRALIQLGYEVSFVATSDMEDQTESEALEQQTHITICSAPFYATVEDVLKRQASCFDLIYLHRAANAEQYLALSRRYQPRARIVYAVADLHHLRLARQAAIQQRPELAAFSRKLALAEFNAARQADDVITHSPFEAQLLCRQVPSANVHVVPWAVPVQPCATPLKDRCGVAFIGPLGHAPNPDAVFWLTQKIMPLVWAQDMTVRCLIVGHGWTRGALPFWDDRIDVVGSVANLQEVFSKVRLTVAPLRFGAGIKGKVLESFAAGIPCVMSSIAAEGLALSPPLQRLVNDGDVAIAQAIVQLHGDGTANQKSAVAGLAMISACHSDQQVTDALSRMLMLTN